MEHVWLVAQKTDGCSLDLDHVVLADQAQADIAGMYDVITATAE